MFSDWISRAESGQDLESTDMESAISEMLHGGVHGDLTAKLLLALRAKGIGVRTGWCGPGNASGYDADHNPPKGLARHLRHRG